jgi:hypothetical protein
MGWKGKGLWNSDKEKEVEFHPTEKEPKSASGKKRGRREGTYNVLGDGCRLPQGCPGNSLLHPRRIQLSQAVGPRGPQPCNVNGLP